MAQAAISSSRPGSTRQVKPFQSSIDTASGSAPASAAADRQRPSTRAGPLGAKSAVWAALTGSTQAAPPSGVRPAHAQHV